MNSGILLSVIHNWPILCHTVRSTENQKVPAHHGKTCAQPPHGASQKLQPAEHHVRILGVPCESAGTCIWSWRKWGPDTYMGTWPHFLRVPVVQALQGPPGASWEQATGCQTDLLPLLGPCPTGKLMSPRSRAAPAQVTTSQVLSDLPQAPPPLGSPAPAL